MYPSVEIFGRTIPTYGLLAAAGLICGLLFVFFCARKYKLDAEDAAYMYTFGFLACGVGAKILYVIVTARQIVEDIGTLGFFPALIAHIQGGLVFYGGLLGAIAGAFITAHYLKRDIREYYPALVPGIAIMAGFGRIGCYLTGCCYGAHTSSSLGVVYPEGGIAPAGVPLVPVQLYEAIFDFILVVVLVVLSAKITGIRPRLLTVYCAAYAVFRFILEFWRADGVRGIWGPFSTSQWISIAILVFLLIKTFKDERAKMIK
jgi:phosphatidylglycerol:prolipoprotein diacylglycerol transferase